MKKNEFVLRINLGNAAASDDADVADILRKAADYVERMGTENNRSYNVRDLNGNTVGAMGRYLSEELSANLGELCPNCAEAVLEDESRERENGLGCPACGHGFKRN